MATPFHGRAIPCHFVSYSSKTINAEATSRNRHHFEAFAEVKDLLSDRLLVLDRKFSYLALTLVFEKINFIIRPKEGAKFTNQDGNLVAMSIKKGETRTINKILYKGKVFVNLIGIWQEGFNKPLWIMINLNAKKGLGIYSQTHEDRRKFPGYEEPVGHGKDGGFITDCLCRWSLVGRNTSFNSVP